MPRMPQTSHDVPPMGVEIVDFPGLLLNADPNDLPSGAAQQQVNVASVLPGELKARAGYRQVTFED